MTFDADSELVQNNNAELLRILFLVPRQDILGRNSIAFQKRPTRQQIPYDDGPSCTQAPCNPPKLLGYGHNYFYGLRGRLVAYVSGHLRCQLREDGRRYQRQ
jgi:hypothetical protein